MPDLRALSILSLRFVVVAALVWPGWMDGHRHMQDPYQCKHRTWTDLSWGAIGDLEETYHDEYVDGPSAERHSKTLDGTWLSEGLVHNGSVGDGGGDDFDPSDARELLDVSLTR